jgi:DNA-binding GntR family transcriptional regulator
MTSALLTAQPVRPAPVRSETLTEQAYNRLEEMIVTLTLAPGAVLSEQALSAELGIGRTPIREALQRLGHEGLVMVLPRKDHRHRHGSATSAAGARGAARAGTVACAREC